METLLQEAPASRSTGCGRGRGRMDGYGGHQVHIVFGSPRSNCAGSGICTAREVFRHETVTPKGCCKGNAAWAWVRMTRAGRLVFDFPALCPRLIQQYFDGDMFQMESDAELELTLKGKSIVFVLPKGIYAVSRRDAGIRITIPGVPKGNTSERTDGKAWGVSSPYAVGLLTAGHPPVRNPAP